MNGIIYYNNILVTLRFLSVLIINVQSDKTFLFVDITILVITVRGLDHIICAAEKYFIFILVPSISLCGINQGITLFLIILYNVMSYVI